MKLIQIKQKELREFRKNQWEKQDKKCPVLNQKVDFENTVVDHQHKKKSDPAGKNGGGLIRGVLQTQANAMEGKIANTFKRMGLGNFITLPEYLRNLADYLDNPPVPPKYIHPKEEEKESVKFLNKTDFERVQKYWTEMYPKRNFPKLPKKKKRGKIVLTKKWEQYIAEAKDWHEKKTGKKLKR